MAAVAVRQAGADSIADTSARLSVFNELGNYPWAAYSRGSLATSAGVLFNDTTAKWVREVRPVIEGIQQLHTTHCASCGGALAADLWLMSEELPLVTTALRVCSLDAMLLDAAVQAAVVDCAPSGASSCGHLQDALLTHQRMRNDSYTLMLHLWADDAADGDTRAGVDLEMVAAFAAQWILPAARTPRYNQLMARLRTSAALSDLHGLAPFDAALEVFATREDAEWMDERMRLALGHAVASVARSSSCPGCRKRLLQEFLVHDVAAHWHTPCRVAREPGDTAWWRCTCADIRLTGVRYYSVDARVAHLPTDPSCACDYVHDSGADLLAALQVLRIAVSRAAQGQEDHHASHHTHSGGGGDGGGVDTDADVEAGGDEEVVDWLWQTFEFTGAMVALGLLVAAAVLACAVCRGWSYWKQQRQAFRARQLFPARVGRRQR